MVARTWLYLRKHGVSSRFRVRTVQAFAPSSGPCELSSLLCPLMPSAVRFRISRLDPQAGIPDQWQISRGKFDRLPHATAEFSTFTFELSNMLGTKKEEEPKLLLSQVEFVALPRR